MVNLVLDPILSVVCLFSLTITWGFTSEVKEWFILSACEKECSLGFYWSIWSSGISLGSAAWSLTHGHVFIWSHSFHVWKHKDFFLRFLHDGHRGWVAIEWTSKDCQDKISLKKWEESSETRRNCDEEKRHCSVASETSGSTNVPLCQWCLAVNSPLAPAAYVAEGKAIPSAQYISNQWQTSLYWPNSC